MLAGLAAASNADVTGVGCAEGLQESNAAPNGFIYTVSTAVETMPGSIANDLATDCKAGLGRLDAGSCQTMRFQIQQYGTGIAPSATGVDIYFFATSAPTSYSQAFSKVALGNSPLSQSFTWCRTSDGTSTGSARGGPITLDIRICSWTTSTGDGCLGASAVYDFDTLGIGTNAGAGNSIHVSSGKLQSGFHLSSVTVSTAQAGPSASTIVAGDTPWVKVTFAEPGYMSGTSVSVHAAVCQTNDGACDGTNNGVAGENVIINGWADGSTTAQSAQLPNEVLWADAFANNTAYFLDLTGSPTYITQAGLPSGWGFVNDSSGDSVVFGSFARIDKGLRLTCPFLLNSNTGVGTVNVLMIGENAECRPNPTVTNGRGETIAENTPLRTYYRRITQALGDTTDLASCDSLVQASGAWQCDSQVKAMATTTSGLSYCVDLRTYTSTSRATEVSEGTDCGLFDVSKTLQVTCPSLMNPNTGVGSVTKLNPSETIECRGSPSIRNVRSENLSVGSVMSFCFRRATQPFCSTADVGRCDATLSTSGVWQCDQVINNLGSATITDATSTLDYVVDAEQWSDTTRSTLWNKGTTSGSLFDVSSNATLSPPTGTLNCGAGATVTNGPLFNRGDQPQPGWRLCNSRNEQVTPTVSAVITRDDTGATEQTTSNLAPTSGVYGWPFTIAPGTNGAAASNDTTGVAKKLSVTWTGGTGITDPAYEVSSLLLVSGGGSGINTWPGGLCAGTQQKAYTIPSDVIGQDEGPYATIHGATDTNPLTVTRTYVEATSGIPLSTSPSTGTASTGTTPCHVVKTEGPPSSHWVFTANATDGNGNYAWTSTQLTFLKPTTNDRMVALDDAGPITPGTIVSLQLRTLEWDATTSQYQPTSPDNPPVAWVNYTNDTGAWLTAAPPDTSNANPTSPDAFWYNFTASANWTRGENVAITGYANISNQTIPFSYPLVVAPPTPGGDPVAVYANDLLLGMTENLTITMTWDNGTARVNSATNVTLQVYAPDGSLVIQNATPTELRLADGSAWGYYSYAFTPTQVGAYEVLANQTTSLGEKRLARPAHFEVYRDTYGLTQYGIQQTNQTPGLTWDVNLTQHQAPNSTGLGLSLANTTIQSESAVSNDTNARIVSIQGSLGYWFPLLGGTENFTNATTLDTNARVINLQSQAGYYLPASLNELNGTLTTMAFRAWNDTTWAPNATLMSRLDANATYYGQGALAAENNTYAALVSVNGQLGYWLPELGAVTNDTNARVILIQSQAGYYFPAILETANGTLTTSGFGAWDAGEFRTAWVMVNGTATRETAAYYGNGIFALLNTTSLDILNLNMTTGRVELNVTAMTTFTNTLVNGTTAPLLTASEFRQTSAKFNGTDQNLTYYGQGIYALGNASELDFDAWKTGEYRPASTILNDTQGTLLYLGGGIFALLNQTNANLTTTQEDELALDNSSSQAVLAAIASLNETTGRVELNLTSMTTYTDGLVNTSTGTITLGDDENLVSLLARLNQLETNTTTVILSANATILANLTGLDETTRAALAEVLSNENGTIEGQLANDTLLLKLRLDQAEGNLTTSLASLDGTTQEALASMNATLQAQLANDTLLLATGLDALNETDASRTNTTILTLVARVGQDETNVTSLVAGLNVTFNGTLHNGLLTLLVPMQNLSMTVSNMSAVMAPWSSVDWKNLEEVLNGTSHAVADMTTTFQQVNYQQQTALMRQLLVLNQTVNMMNEQQSQGLTTNVILESVALEIIKAIAVVGGVLLLSRFLGWLRARNKRAAARLARTVEPVERVLGARNLLLNSLASRGARPKPRH